MCPGSKFRINTTIDRKPLTIDAVKRSVPNLSPKRFEKENSSKERVVPSLFLCLQQLSCSGAQISLQSADANAQLSLDDRDAG